MNQEIQFILYQLPDEEGKVQVAVLAAPESAKWIEGKQIRKVIYVPKKIVNIVVG